MNCCLIVLLGLLSVGLTSGQTEEKPAKGRMCYSCDYYKDGEQCIHEPMRLNTDTHSVTCSSAYGQCYFTYYSDEKGERMFGRRGCAENMESLPFGLSMDKIEGCHRKMGYRLCHFRCGNDFCNHHIPHDQTVARAPALLPGLVAGAGFVMVVMIRKMLL